MTTPRFQSTKIPGLVMWPNGAIVRVRVENDAVITKEKYGESGLTTTGTIVRDKNGTPEVITSYGRVDLHELTLRELGLRSDPEKRKTLEEKVFELVEAYEEQKRRDLEFRVMRDLSLLIVKRARARAKT